MTVLQVKVLPDVITIANALVAIIGIYSDAELITCVDNDMNPTWAHFKMNSCQRPEPKIGDDEE